MEKFAGKPVPDQQLKAIVDELHIPLRHPPSDMGPGFAHLNVLDWSAFTPADYCSAVSAFFIQQAHDIKVEGAGLTEWNRWSLALNKMWIQRCHDKRGNQQFRFALVYWWNRNEYLRLLIEWPLHKEARKKKLNKDAKVLRMAANNRKALKPSNKLYVRVVKNYSAIFNHLRKYYNKVAAEEAEARKKEEAHTLTALREDKRIEFEPRQG